jgi:hypothetical protein
LRPTDWRTGMAPHGEDVCPGYTTTMPEVIEAARALQWRNHGALVALYDDLPLPPTMAVAIDIVDAAVKDVEADVMRAAAEKRS